MSLNNEFEFLYFDVIIIKMPPKLNLCSIL